MEQEVTQKSKLRDSWYCNWAPSLGSLESTAEEIWGTPKYNFWRHRKKNLIQFGCYDLRDYITVWLHRGRVAILWAGSDIRNLGQGFMFNDGKLGWLSRILKFRFWKWIIRTLQKAEHWVENEKERDDLAQCGVWVAGVCPSFLGNVNDFKVEFKAPKNELHAYVSSGNGRQEEYGFGIVERIAGDLPWVRFHLYGAPWETKHKNVQVHGRVPKFQMNQEIKKYHLGLRLNETDGFSEIMAKAVLMGQYAIGKVEHLKIPSYDNDMDLIAKINKIRHIKIPNVEVGMWYKKILNRYPWNKNVQNY